MKKLDWKTCVQTTQWGEFACNSIKTSKVQMRGQTLLFCWFRHFRDRSCVVSVMPRRTSGSKWPIMGAGDGMRFRQVRKPTSCARSAAVMWKWIRRFVFRDSTIRCQKKTLCQDKIDYFVGFECESTIFVCVMHRRLVWYALYHRRAVRE